MAVRLPTRQVLNSSGMHVDMWSTAGEIDMWHLITGI